MDNYFVITASSDGIQVIQMEHAELTQRLAEGYWGEYQFVDVIPDPDPNYWRSGALIIKGRAVIPTAKEVITAWEVP